MYVVEAFNPMNSRLEAIKETEEFEEAKELADAVVHGLHDHAFVVEDEKVLYYAPEE